MRIQELQSDINKTFKELLEIISSVQQDQINIVPFEGSWTAGQVAEHIILSASGFEEVMNGPVAETKRAPDELKEKIKASFLDFTTKMKSPDFIVPEYKNYEKDDLIKTLENLREKIIQAIETLDLTKTCLAFELPVLGFLTRLESIYFILYHTQRHIHQIKGIYQKIKETKSHVAEK